MREVFYHPRVPTEVREILKHYRQTSDQLADEFWEELMDSVGDIQQVITTIRVGAGVT